MHEYECYSQFGSVIDHCAACTIGSRKVARVVHPHNGLRWARRECCDTLCHAGYVATSFSILVHVCLKTTSWCHAGFAPQITVDDKADADNVDSTDNDVGIVSEESVPLSELDWEFELGPTGGLQIVSHGSFQEADTGVVETDKSGHASTADIEDMRNEEPELLWEG